jgi:IQ calmodulin-binding motif
MNGNISAINNANNNIISNKNINSSKNQNKNKNENESEKKAAKKSAIKIQSVIRRFLVSTRFKRTYDNDSDNNNNVTTEEKRDKGDKRRNCSDYTQHTVSLYHENKKVNKENSSRKCGGKNRSEKVGKESMLVKKEETMSKKETRKGEVIENEKEKEKWEIAQTLSTSMKMDKLSNASMKVDKRCNEKAAVKTVEPVHKLDGNNNSIPTFSS